MTDKRERIEGQCPMGCGRTLFVDNNGYVTCSFTKCLKPNAASQLLENSPRYIQPYVS